MKLLKLNIQHFARNKNALRGHFVQEYTPGQETPGTEWLELAKWISTIGDDTQETSEDVAYYDKLNCRFVG